MSEAGWNELRRAIWRMAILLLGGLLAAGVAVWSAERLSLNEGQLRVSQGPHLYVRGSNYPPRGLTRAASAGDLQEADAPRRENTSNAIGAQAS